MMAALTHTYLPTLAHSLSFLSVSLVKSLFFFCCILLLLVSCPLAPPLLFIVAHCDSGSSDDFKITIVVEGVLSLLYAPIIQIPPLHSTFIELQVPLVRTNRKGWTKCWTLGQDVIDAMKCIFTTSKKYFLSTNYLFCKVLKILYICGESTIVVRD